MDKLAEQEILDSLSEREKDRQLELEKARIQNSADTNSLVSTVSVMTKIKIKRSLKDLVP